MTHGNIMNPVLTIKSAEFIKSAFQPDHYPPAQLPEVAFAGRSNVGKSSLINCIVQRKKLVRTSRTPGQTQAINFFLINKAFYFVDLPGYGFAKVPQRIKAQWGPMVETYLTQRSTLKGVVHILDLRHPPTPEDLSLQQWLAIENIPSVPVLTKADKMKRSKWPPFVTQAAAHLGIPADSFVLFSSETGQGRNHLIEVLHDWVSEPESL